MGSVIAVVPIAKPALDFVHRHQIVDRRQTQHFLDGGGIDGFTAMAVFLQGFFNQFKRGFLRQFIAFDDGIAENFLINAAGLRSLVKPQ